MGSACSSWLPALGGGSSGQFDAWLVESACCLVPAGPSQRARESSPGQATRCLKGKSPQPQGLERLLAQMVGPPRAWRPVCADCPLATSGQPLPTRWVTWPRQGAELLFATAEGPAYPDHLLFRAAGQETPGPAPVLLVGACETPPGLVSLQPGPLTHLLPSAQLSEFSFGSS